MKAGMLSRRELSLAIGYCRRKKPGVWARFVAANPSWCIFRGDIAGEKKAALLAMPLGSARPGRKKRGLGLALCNYTRKESCSYDPDFDRKIRARRPEWFVTRRDRSAAKKRELLAMPRGCARPNIRARGLGVALCCYTARGRRGYDADFDRRVRARHPGWFVTPASIVAQKKAELFSMPIGSPRPLRRVDRVSAHLVEYARRELDPRRKHPYDVEFSAKLKERFPHWFERESA